jgi:hypothetical protein
MSGRVTNQMRVVAAIEGGFIVYEGLAYRGDGMEGSPLPSYAGPLANCLDFMRNKLSPPEAEVCACRQTKPDAWRPV